MLLWEVEEQAVLRRQPRRLVTAGRWQTALRTASTLGRPLDLRYPTNLAIVALAMLCWGVGTAMPRVQGVPWPAAALQGLIWAGSMLLGWALGREADPDHPLSAFLAAGGSLAACILLGPPGFLLGFWALIGMRAINRSPGAVPGVLDLVVLGGMTLWLGVSVHWLFAALGSPAVGMLGMSRRNTRLRIGLTMLLPLLSVVIAAACGHRLDVSRWREPEGVAVIALVFLAAIAVRGYRHVRSVGDRDQRLLGSGRVQAALAWAAVTPIALSVADGVGFRMVAPIAAAVAAAAVGRVAARCWRVMRGGEPTP